MEHCEESNKPCYTKRQAQTVRNRRTGPTRRRKRRDSASFLRIYQCPYCNHWHLTHKEKKDT